MVGLSFQQFSPILCHWKGFGAPADSFAGWQWLKAVRVPSVPRCPSGTTAGCTTSGVGTISGWCSSSQNLPTSPPPSSPCWACRPSRGAPRRQLCDLGWSCKLKMFFSFIGVRLRPAPRNVQFEFTDWLQRDKSQSEFKSWMLQSFVAFAKLPNVFS